MSRVAPYSAQDTAQAAEWLDYVSDSFADISGTSARVGAIQEAIDKLERRGAISPGCAVLLAETYDVPHRPWKCRRCSAETAEPDVVTAGHMGGWIYRAPCCGPCGQYFSAQDIETALSLA